MVVSNHFHSVKSFLFTSARPRDFDGMSMYTTKTPTDFCGVFNVPQLKEFLTYSVTHVRNSEIKQLLTLFFAMLWNFDLIFGIWVYNNELQIKFTFCSGPMIFGRVMALGLWNLARYLVVTTFFSLCLEIFSLCFNILTWYLVCGL